MHKKRVMKDIKQRNKRNIMLKASVVAASLAVLSAVPVFAAGVSFAPPVQKIFTNWQVTCNNLNDCDVRNIDENLRITLSRQAGATGVTSLTIVPFSQEAHPTLWLDEDSVEGVNLTPSINDDDAIVATENLPAIQYFLHQAKDALTLSVGDNPQQGSSLRGLNAALMLVDERQGRIGTQGALLQRGSKPASDVPARLSQTGLPPALTNVPAVSNPQTLVEAVIKAQHALLVREACDVNEQDTEMNQVQPLDERNALVMINCGMGAYQSSSLVFITPRDNPSASHHLVLPLPLPDEDGHLQQVDWFTNADFDPQTGDLFHLAKGRGFADCGERAQWRYDGQQFRLMTYHSQPGCHGGWPGEWPSLWETPGYDEDNRR